MATKPKLTTHRRSHIHYTFCITPHLMAHIAISPFTLTKFFTDNQHVHAHICGLTIALTPPTSIGRTLCAPRTISIQTRSQHSL